MGDRAAERRLRGALGVDVDPLVVAGDVGEGVDLVLGDVEPLADAQLLADPGLEVVDAGDREHGCGIYALGPRRAGAPPTLAGCPRRCSPSTPRRCSTARSSRCPKSITGAGRHAGQRAAGHGEPGAAGRRAPRRRARWSSASARRPPTTASSSIPLPRRPPADARRARAPVAATPRRSSRRSAGSSCATRRSRPTTCSARSPTPRPRPAGGRCCSPATATCSSASRDAVTRAVAARGKDGPEVRSTPAERARALRHRARAGARLHRPARRPVRRPARRARASARRRRASCCATTARSTRVLELPIGVRPRVRGALRGRPTSCARSAHIATLQPVDLEPPPDAPTDFDGGARRPRQRGMNRLAERLRAWGGR